MNVIYDKRIMEVSVILEAEKGKICFYQIIVKILMNKYPRVGHGPNLHK